RPKNGGASHVPHPPRHQPAAIEDLRAPGAGSLPPGVPRGARRRPSDEDTLPPLTSPRPLPILCLTTEASWSFAAYCSHVKQMLKSERLAAFFPAGSFCFGTLESCNDRDCRSPLYP